MGFSWKKAKKLLNKASFFQHQINTDPVALSDRLWVKKHLELEEEKLRFLK